MSLWEKIKGQLPASKQQVKLMNSKLSHIEVQLDELNKANERLDKNYTKYLERKFKFTDSQIEHKFQDVNSRILDIRNRFMQAELRELLLRQNEILQRQNDMIQKYNNILEQSNHQIKVLQHEVETFKSKSINVTEETLGYARENNWGIVFNNTIDNCEWFEDQALSLGRWAIGYQCAYVLFRILDEVKPKKILEMGLGQSTKILGQYASYHENIQHKVVESDLSWIEFFRNNYKLSDNTNIVHCDCEFSDYKEAKDIRVFAGFGEKIAGDQFDLIVIDAPVGGDMKDYSRIDILRCLPECLADTFVIVIDDAERSGEQNTWNAMKYKLEEANIPYAAGLYRGKKFAGIIVSENLKFLLTM